jgi:hypothetical protein
MKKPALKSLLTPLGLATISLALLFTLLSLLARPIQASTTLQRGAPPLPRTAKLIPISIKTAEGLFQATGVPSISNITGATYDEARGEIVIFGIADP